MRTGRRLGVLRFPAALVGGLIAAVLYLAAGPRLIDSRPAQAAALAPSAQTIDFVAAYASGDEPLADSLASPLYRAEWARRGLDPRARMSLRGMTGEGSAARPGLRFEYVGGACMREGFCDYLYAAWPIRDGLGERAYSVWRVDSDPEGRVVWLELVWLFGPDTRALYCAGDVDSLAEVPVPEDAESLGLTPIAGIVSENTGEGHYILGPRRGEEPGEPGDVPIRTYSVDRYGMIRPGMWTFAIGDSLVRPYPPSRAPEPKIEVEAKDKPLLEGYLRVLG